MSVAREPSENCLLASLDLSESRHWLPHLEWIEMPQAMVLQEADEKPAHAYFPITAVVSLVHVMDDGTSPDVALVGNEGVVGVSLFLGGESATSRAVVLSAGQGYRMSAHAVAQELAHGAGALRPLLRYAQALMTQMGQTSACHRHHSLSQQLCRWLLLNLDRLPSAELAMTQESIAHSLGVRREAVSDAALKLQEASLIRYTRGHIEILDRHRLEERACGCYGVIRREYDRLLPRPHGVVGAAPARDP